MANVKHGTNLRGHAAMLCFSALVAGSFSLGSLAANEIAPIAITTARFLISAIILGIAMVALRRFSRTDFFAPWRYLILGCLLAIYFVLMFEGLKTAPPVSAAAVFTLTPIMAAIIGYLLLRQITTVRMAVALTFGATGALWVIFRADITALLQLRIGRGELIYFWGCVAHATYPPVLVLLNRGESALAFTFATLIAGSLLLTALGWQDILATDWLNLPMVVWITLGYISVFASALTFLLMQYASLRLPAAKVLAYTYLVPSWVILWELVLGKEVPQTIVLGGVVITLIALFLLIKNEQANRET
ncbi:MAG: DMT family transporter [Aestuariivita sp.]|nr:DMT family transporter [Aestuariivita sp.]MCY4201549.1 DMT family transporter [Aestuariivita sp.]MCY4289569.1 DMT family transporter [Aestuariivita sp.]MCY4345792.1 DMT family transporter [Aestuariivita sp.]